MTREQALDFLQLLSALESWGFSNGQKLPVFLHHRLIDAIDTLRKEVLNGS